MEMTKTEALAMAGIILKEQEIQRLYIQPLQETLQSFFGEMEVRLGLEPGAIGKTHTIDIATNSVVAKEENAEITDTDTTT